MCDDRHHRGHHRGECHDDGHHRGRGRGPGRGRHRHHQEERCHHEDRGGHQNEEHYFHGCDCSLEEKLIYLERMLAYKKADVAALEAILEVLKESLVEDDEESEED